jgi:glutaredoxin-related protein
MIAASGLDTIPQLQADGKYVGDADAVQQLVDEGSFGSLFSS